jgi:hypothetical protein
MVDGADGFAAGRVVDHEVADFERGEVGHPLHSTHPECVNTHR